MSITDAMVFEDLRDSIEALLLANQSTYFRTIGEEKQAPDAREALGNLRFVEVFFNEGDQGSGSTETLAVHDVKYQLVFTVSATATADTSVLEKDSGATAEQKAAALLASTAGTRIAGQSMDAFYRMVWQIIMDPVNKDLGLAKYTVGKRVLSGFKKGSPVDHGNIVTIMAIADLTANVDEVATGATPTTAVEPAINVDSEFHTAGEDTDEVDPALTRTDIDTTP